MDWSQRSEQAVASLQQALAVTNGLEPYIQAVIHIDLGPQSLIVDGQVQGSWDPTAGMPVESAVSAAQQHCDDVSALVYLLSEIPEYLSGLDVGRDLQTCLDTLDAVVQAGGTPTDAQRQAILSALQDISSLLPGLQTFMQGLPTRMKTFIDQTNSDSRALTQGDSAIGNSLMAMKSAYQQACLHYAVGPGGSAIVQVLGQIYEQTSTQLQSIGTSLTAATDAAPAAVDAMSALQGIAISLASDFQDFVQQIQQAESDQLVAVLQRFDLQGAQDCWNELLAQ